MKVRIALVALAAAATAALALPAAASAVGGQITYWNDTGDHAIDNPDAGVCYTLTYGTFHVANDTDQEVDLFDGPYCDSDFEALEPGQSADNLPGTVSVMVFDNPDG